MKNILVVGSLNMDFSLEVESAPRPGETVLGKKLNILPGGKGANQAYAIGKLGGKVSMIGAVGDDTYGEKLIQNLASVNVNTEGILKVQNEITGQAFITIDEKGENRIIVMQGANASISKQWILECESIIKESDLVLMQVEIPIPIVLFIAEKAKELGKTVILDPAPASSEFPKELWSYVDVAKPNETELATITGMPTETEEEIVEAARTLIEFGTGTILVTLGEKGSLIVTKDDSILVPARKVEAVDTTAAGDSYIAAFSMLFSGENYVEAVEFASKVAAVVVRRTGAQSSIPSKDEI